LNCGGQALSPRNTEPQAIGPLVLLRSSKAEALFWTMGAVHLAVAAYAVYRIVVKEGNAVSEQKHYLPIPARSSSLIGVLTRGRRPRNGAPPE